MRMVTGRGTSFASKNSIAYGKCQNLIKFQTFKEKPYLCYWEELEQFVDEEIVIPIITCDVRLKLRDILGAGSDEYCQLVTD